MSKKDIDILSEYYQYELSYLRTAGSDFAARFPKIARRLDISSHESSDPQIERMIESFAFLTGKLQKQIDLAANKKDSALIFTATAFMNEQGEPAKYILHVPYKITYWQLLKQNIISCSSVFVKKECMRDVKMPGDQMHEDFAAWLQILKKIPCAYGIDEPLLNYRISSGTKSSNKIKAFKMTMRVYKYIGLNIFERMYYMCWYVFKNLLKYAQIKLTYKCFIFFSLIFYCADGGAGFLRGDSCGRCVRRFL